MGRPIKKVNFGTLATTGEQIQIQAWTPGDSQSRTGSIVRQKSSKSYIVSTVAAGGTTGVCKLVNGTPSVAGEMSIKVFPYNSSAEGTGATASAVMRVKTIAVNAGGTGYTTGNVITVTGGTGTSCTATVTASGGVVTGLVIVNAGAYTALPSVTGAATTVAPAGGTGLTVDLTFEIGSVTIGAGGTDYNLANATFSPSSTTAATVVITSGAVTGLTFTNRGTYTAVPTIAIAAAGSAVTKYVARLYAHLVKTFDGLVYPWKAQSTSIVSGQAHVESA